jgi:hypothetical protein
VLLEAPGFTSHLKNPEPKYFTSDVVYIMPATFGDPARKSRVKRSEIAPVPGLEGSGGL